MTAALTCEALRHRYETAGENPWILNGIDFEIQRGETAVLCGPSGSGKTTLLSVAGCLLTPSDGNVFIGGKRVSGNGSSLSDMRRLHIGFVFQHAQLLPFLTVEDNLSVVAGNLGLAPEVGSERIGSLLEKLEMSEHAQKEASVLSGGQRQRVAVARALLGKPDIILADEPTAALGWNIGQVVIDLLVNQAQEHGCGLLVVTHDARLLPKFQRYFEIERGKLNENRLSQT